MLIYISVVCYWSSDIPKFAHSSTCWWTLELFPVFGCYKSLYGHTLSFLFCNYLGVEWLSFVADACLSFWETTKLFFQSCSVLLYIHINIVWEFHSLTAGDGCAVVSHSSLIYISLVTNDVEYLLMVYLPSISSLVKCLFKSFVHFLKIGLSLLILSCKTSLYILNASHLSIV